MKRLLRLAGFFFLAVAGLVFVLGWSQPGLRLLAKTAVGFTGGNVTYQAVYGTLASAWEVEKLKVHTPAADISVGSVKMDWRPLEIFQKRLHLISFTVQGVEVAFLKRDEDRKKEEKKGPIQISLPALELPVEVLLDKIRIENTRLSSASISEIAFIEHLQLSLSGKETTFHLTQFDLKARGYSADLRGRLDTVEGWQVELGGDAVFSDYGVGPLAGTLDIDGPIERLGVHVELDQPTRATVDGEITGLPNGFEWQAELDIEKFQLEDAHGILPKMMIGAKGPAYGDLRNYNGNLKGNLDYLFFDDVDFQIELSGNYDQIEFPYIHAANKKGEAELVSGLLSWKEKLSWRGELALVNVDPSMIHDYYSGRISLKLLSGGEYTSSNGLELFGDFTDIKGVLRDFPLEGKGRIDIAESTISLSGVEFASDEAELDFAGMLRMAEGLNKPEKSLEWQADVSVEGLNPSMFFPDYPGTLSGRAATKGTRLEDDLAGELLLENLEGVVRDYPVAGSGELTVTSELLKIDNVLLKSGQSELSVTGQVNDELDLAIALNSPDLSEFLVDLSGRLDLSGKVSGDRSRPEITASLLGANVGYQDSSINQIKAEVSGGLEQTSPISAEVEAFGVTLGPEAPNVDKVKLVLEGLVEDHELTVLIQVEDSMADFIMEGGLSDSMQWDGELQRFRVSDNVLGTWGQKDKAALSLSKKLANLQSLCLTDGAERVCLSGLWKADDQSFSVDIGWRDVDLARLQPFVPVKEPIWGTSSADFTFAGVEGRVEVGSGLMAVARAGMGYRDEQAEEDWELTDLDSATVRLNLVGDNLTARLESYFANQSTFSMDAEISGIDSIAEGLDALGLQGTIEADIRSLDFVAPLTDYRVRPSGFLDGIIDLSGTVANPVVEGDLRLNDGVLDVPALGISLENVQFGVSGAERGVRISAEADSGKGWLRANGDLQFGEAGISGDFRFTGDNFDAVMLPEYAVQATPDLRLRFDREGGDLSGKLHIPSALIMPKNLKAAVNESSDVVFVDGAEEEKVAGWKFGMSVLITLGDEVKVSGYGLSGDLVGNLQIDMVPGSIVTGKGELSLENGVFSVYGRSLDLVRSKLLFGGGPIDNPGIDARAEKIVSEGDATSEPIEVGVDVTGTVDNLEFILFSDPPMDDTDILAYMVVGRSMSNTGQQDENLLGSVALALGLETSVGLVDRLTSLLPIDDMYIEGTTSEEMSLVVGKKLTDELYIGYDHNFFDQLGEWLLRYDLGKGFSVETRSSTEATGADILYSFER